MAQTTTGPSIQHLCIAVKEMDGVAADAFNGIQAVAMLVLEALENPKTCLNTDLMARALEAIKAMACDAANVINCSAEAVGCNYIDAAHRRRWDARCEAMAKEGN